MIGVYKIKQFVALAVLGVFATASASRGMEVKEALAQFESGASGPARCAADAKIGTRKEVSRFQILPAVWRKYSTQSEYRDPAAAWDVAQRILADRYTWFRSATGREWDSVDFYIMWNAPGDYQRAGWDRYKVSRVVLQRARLFANLLDSEERLLVRASQ